MSTQNCCACLVDLNRRIPRPLPWLPRAIAQPDYYHTAPCCGSPQASALDGPHSSCAGYRSQFFRVHRHDCGITLFVLNLSRVLQPARKALGRSLARRRASRNPTSPYRAHRFIDAHTPCGKERRSLLASVTKCYCHRTALL